MSDAVQRVRLVGMAEGVSFLVLLLVAMPLKYFAGVPEAVLVVGWMHGVLFVAYAVVTVYAVIVGRLSVGLMFLAAGAALLPGGPFLIDDILKKSKYRNPKSETNTKPE